MVMNVIRDHHDLYAAIRARHPRLYTEHATEIIVRSNALMNRCGMNWLDEREEPITLRAMKRQRAMYESIVAVRVQRGVQRGLQRLLGRGARA
jgi:hypothetical protein